MSPALKVSVVVPDFFRDRPSKVASPSVFVVAEVEPASPNVFGAVTVTVVPDVAILFPLASWRCSTGEGLNTFPLTTLRRLALETKRVGAPAVSLRDVRAPSRPAGVKVKSTSPMIPTRVKFVNVAIPWLLVTAVLPDSTTSVRLDDTVTTTFAYCLATPLTSTSCTTG